MKLVIATIHPVRLRAVQEALGQVEVQRITVCDAQEFVSPADFSGSRQGRNFQATLRRMITLEIAVNDDFLERTVRAIERVSGVHRGQIVNSGSIYVVSLENVVSFFPEKNGPGAI